MIALLVSGAYAAGIGCSEDPVAAVDVAMTSVWQAFDAVDEEAFDRSGKLLAAAIACYDAPASPVQVSRLHQAMALVSFVNGQSRASRRALAAARLMDPGWKLDDELFPEGHPFRDLYAAAIDPGPVTPIGRIAPDAWIVDGVEREEAPIERAFLLQVRENEQIVWSGYTFSFEEIPERGQSRKRSALTAPYVAWVSFGPHGRLVSSRQIADVPVAWGDESGAAVGGGATLTARLLPLTVVGFEAGGSLSGPTDPIAGGGGQPSGHALLLLGGAFWTGDLQPFAALRVGGSVDRMRSWGPADPAEVSLWTIPSLVTGLEAGVRTSAWRTGLASDFLLASGSVPYQVRVRADGGRSISGPLAFEGSLDFRSGGLPFRDTDDREVGKRSDVDVRLGVAIALWK